MTTSNYRRSLDRFLVQYRTACQAVRRERQALQQAKQQAETVLAAQQLVQQVAEQVQAQAHRQIASVVARCLKAVFGEDSYGFRINFRRARGRTEARLCFVRDGCEFDPLDAAGGGVVDVAAFALRLACLVLVRPRRRQLLCLDEPFKHLSRDYRQAVRELLLALSKELGVQMILITHAAELAVGKVIELE